MTVKAHRPSVIKTRPAGFWQMSASTQLFSHSWRERKHIKGDVNVDRDMEMELSEVVTFCH